MFGMAWIPHASACDIQLHCTYEGHNPWHAARCVSRQTLLKAFPDKKLLEESQNDALIRSVVIL